MKFPPESLRPLHHRDQLPEMLRLLGVTGPIVEVGTLYGGYAAVLQALWPGEIHCVDPWRNQPRGIYHDGANLLDMEDVYRQARARLPRCTLHRMMSLEAVGAFADNSLAAVFLDGNHALPAIRADIAAWFPKVKIGGVFGGHDFYIRYDNDTNSDAQTAVMEFAEAVGQWPQVTWCNSWWFVKTEEMERRWADSCDEREAAKGLLPPVSPEVLKAAAPIMEAAFPTFQNEKIELTPEGVAVVRDDTHLSKWVREHKTLAVAAPFLRQFRQYIPSGGVVVDVGACIGDHTVTYADMIGPDGLVHAFEPNPVAYECLAYNLSAHHTVMLYPIGLGTRSGTARVSSSPNLGASQLVSCENGDVVVKAIDEIASTWSRLDWMKIDAEGCEMDIINGASETIKRLRPVMLVEVNRALLPADGAAALVKLIEALGYVVKPAEAGWSMEMEMVDVLCLPR